MLFDWLLYLVLLSWTVAEEQLYVVPSSSSISCPKDPCYTLTDVVLNRSQYFRSDTVIKFLPGNHQTNITKGLSVLIKDVRNISMIGYDHTNSDSKSVIQCTGPLGFAFINVTTLKIAKLSFSSCGADIFAESKVDRFPPKTVTLYFLRTTNAIISEVAINNSADAGIIGINMFGHSNISHTVFSGNRPNCLIIFLDNFKFKVIPPTYLNISNSHAMFGKIPKPFLMYYRLGATGLAIILTQTLYKVHIQMDNIQTRNNTINKLKLGYGNLRLVIGKWECNCSVIQAKQIASTNAVKDKAYVQLMSIKKTNNPLTSCKCPKPAEEEYTVHISDSFFEGVGVRVNTDTKDCNTRIKLQNITMHNNSVLHISAMKSIIIQDINFNHSRGMSIDDGTITASGGCYFTQMQTAIRSVVSLFRSTISFTGGVKFIENRVQKATVLLLNNSTIKFQHSAELVSNKGKVGGIIALYNSSQLVFGEQSNVTFLRNYAQQYGGAILVDGSTIIVESEATAAFIENEAYNGGALALQNDARIMLKSNSRITFIKNHAQQYGGALYVEEPTPKIEYHLNSYKIRCFFELPSHLHAILNLTFANNTADSAGSILYGGWVDFCDSSNGEPGVLAFNETFHFQDIQSEVSSNPARVCICNNDLPDCSITHYNVTAYPGETFQIPAVAVGQMFGTVPFTVQSRFTSINSSSHPQIKPLQKTQMVRKTCTNLTYTVTSNHQTEEMILTVDKVDKLPIQYINIQTSKLSKLPLVLKDFHLHIQLTSCPLGFVLNDFSCICYPQLQNITNCSIDTQKVYRRSSMWINATFTNGSQDEVLVHKHCPFDYCKPDSIDLDLENPDEQCASHRSGILCGECQHNLSHVFGTSACRECSSLWTLLWVPLIALAGIALVVLLIALNLTVSVGTINGLIFYANIVRANHATFFPPNTTNSFLSWFIAWINLDLGIETCFYNGLDAYVKTWLQFIFPLYIWLIVVLIIVFSHYFDKIAKLSGKNAVQVLATLFLLSYAKLLRIIITVFSFTLIKYPDKTVIVWLYDGNVNYIQEKHIPLFVAAVILLLAISVPYTGVLLFIQCFQKFSSHKLLSWIHKLKPLLDAYTGPYKDRHRYWTGLLLLVRAILFLIFSVANPDINLLVITLTAFSLLTHGAVAGQIYKTWILNTIEYSFLLNLGVLSCATFYTRASDQEDSRGATSHSQTEVVYTSVATALVTFTVIVVMHIVKKAKSFPQCNRAFSEQVTSKLLQLRGRATLAMKRKHHHSPLPSPAASPTSIQLRESLLEYCVND